MIALALSSFTSPVKKMRRSFNISWSQFTVPLFWVLGRAAGVAGATGAAGAAGAGGSAGAAGAEGTTGGAGAEGAAGAAPTVAGDAGPAGGGAAAAPVLLPEARGAQLDEDVEREASSA